MAGGPGFLSFISDFASIGGSVVNEVRQMLPRLEDEVVVEIQGQPGSSKKQLYFLALAAANGIVRRFNDLITFNPLMPPPMAALIIEYDAADHWVRCTLKYSVGTLSAMASTGPNAGKFYEAAAIYSGPECEVVGGEFNFTVGGAKRFAAGVGFNAITGGLAVAAAGFAAGILPDPLNGVPESSKSKGAPPLEFKDRTILTPCPKVVEPIPGFGPPTGTVIDSPNPKPPGDNRSRSAVVRPGDLTGVLSTSSSPTGDPCCSKSLELIPLFFAALSNPGSFEEEVFGPPVQGPKGG